MKNAQIISSLTIALALAGCGGSGESGGAAGVGSGNTAQVGIGSEVVSSAAPVATTDVETQSTSPSEDQNADVVVQADTPLVSPVENEADNQANISVAENQNQGGSVSPQVEATQAEDVQADTETTQEEALANVSAPVANSFCEPATTTAVSFEEYCHTSRSDCTARLGTYVPFPASGFAWDGSQLCDAASSFGIDTVEVLVPYVSDRPDIDGFDREDSWGDAVLAGTSDFETVRNDIDNLQASPVEDYLDGAGYTTWQAMHDGTNLYIKVKLTNDTVSGAYSDSVDPWNDDSLELFIDGDNSKGEQYDGVNDFQAILRLGSEDWQPYISGASPQSLGIFYRAADYRVTNGSASWGTYYEIAINMESAGLEVGKPFGFDLQVNEDDNGGDRDAKWGWFERSSLDRSWFQPSVFGTLMLTECEDPDACGSYQQLSQ